jgi:hypothetical protein
MRALVLALLVASPALASELDDARESCAKKGRDCDKVQQLENAERSASVHAREAELAAARAKLDAEIAEQEQAEAKAEADLRAKCGKDFHRVRVGMRWERVRQCAGEFEVRAQDERGTVYEAAGGLVRVENGRVTRWIAR